MVAWGTLVSLLDMESVARATRLGFEARVDLSVIA